MGLLLFLCSRTAHAILTLSSSQTLQELGNLRQLGSVLLIAAHPDDENNQLLAFFRQGKGYRTGYLSLTRGEGGQNLIGSEQGEALGVLRTQELMAARRVDGAQQFFTRAIDFGFTKDYRDCFRFWDHQAVLGDVVRVIRTFRPDVILTRFSPEPGNTHGHHTASAMLALEAFRVAADPTAYPEQLSDLKPWQAKRILWNVGIGNENKSQSLSIEIGGYEPLLGESFGEIGSRSRSMHRSQGMSRAAARGSRQESFVLLDGSPATQDIFEGVTNSWGQFRQGGETDKLLGDLISKFKVEDPSASVPDLLKLQDFLQALPKEPLIEDKLARLNFILQSCLGIYLESTTSEARLTPGQEFKLKHSVISRTGTAIQWKGVRYPSLQKETGESPLIVSNQLTSLESTLKIPLDAPISQPYWLRAKGTDGMYRVDEPGLIGTPENPPVFPVQFVFKISGHTVVINDEAVQVSIDPAKGERREPLKIVPPVRLDFVDDLEVFTPGKAKEVLVRITSNAQSGLSGKLKIEVPKGWTVKPDFHPFQLAGRDSLARFSFTVKSPSHPDQEPILAFAEIGQKRYSVQQLQIQHDFLPPQLLQNPATLNALNLNFSVQGRDIGYISGSGDLIPACLRQMGYRVSVLTAEDLNSKSLNRFDAIVMGVRAANVRKDLVLEMPALLAYVKSGGTLISQYNTPDNLQIVGFSPFELKLSTDRVTNPMASVKILDPSAELFLVPNKIGLNDFDGWIQERGRNFPSDWGVEFKPMLEFSDPVRGPQRGSLLIAKFGKGHFIYTGLSFFRQLPEGVPGALRLFANLLSVGKMHSPMH